MGGKGSGKPNAELLKLDGTQITSEGKIERTDFFNFLDLTSGDYSHIELTPEEALSFRNQVVRLKYGTSAAIPILCAGKECPFAKVCPLQKVNKAPLTEPCPIETNLVTAWTKSYIEDLDVDPNSITEMVLVNSLVELDVKDYRANIGLAGANDEEAPTLLHTNITTTDGDRGTTVVETLTTHPLLDTKERNHRARLQTLEVLAATRREKYKRAAALKKGDDSDISRHYSKLRNALKAIETAEENNQLNQIAAEADKAILEDGIIEADWSKDGEFGE